jgi:hypothetical protein
MLPSAGPLRLPAGAGAPGPRLGGVRQPEGEEKGEGGEGGREKVDEGEIVEKGDGVENKVVFKILHPVNVTAI